MGLDIGVVFSPPVLMGGLAFILTYVYLKHRRPAGYPPGPPNLPIVGSVLSIPKLEPIEAMVAMAKKYGPVFSFSIGNENFVFLTDYKSITEACLKKGTDFAGRTEFYNFTQVSPFYPEHKGIIDANYSENWKQERHTALSVLRQLGYGKSVIETRILEEFHHFLDGCLSQKDRAFHMADHINNAVANIICALLFGERFDYESTEFQELRHTSENVIKFVMEYPGAAHIPILRYAPGYRSYLEKFRSCYGHWLDFIIRRIQEHGEEGQMDSPRDFIDGYAKLSKQEGKEKKSWLISHLEDFFMAGMETTTTTLGWGLYFMIKYPHIQSRVQEELDRVVGPGRDVSLADRPQLPYVEATLLELLRMASTAPMALPHQTLVDTEVAGYRIPKDTQVIMFLWNVHHDPQTWPEPEIFKTERFLDNAGKVVKKEELIPFGVGRRSCLGEQLARQELFLFFANIFKSVNIKLPDGAVLPPQKGVMAVTHQPPVFDVCIQVR